MAKSLQLNANIWCGEEKREFYVAKIASIEQRSKTKEREREEEEKNSQVNKVFKWQKNDKYRT